MNTEIIEKMLEANNRLKKAMSMLKKSRYLSELETTKELFLYFNEHYSCLEVVVRDNYEKMVESLRMLRGDNIYLEFDTSWDCGDEYYFRYGKRTSAVQLVYSCKSDDVPEQMIRYKGK